MQPKTSDFHELPYFGRYRDDCLSLWTDSVQRLNDFFTYLNSLDNDLQFTMEIGDSEICFLDLKISLENNKLSTTVYSKPTDSHLYLHAKSCHKSSSIDGIQKGVALRLRRICSTDNEYSEKSKEYQQYLTNRGHDKSKVKTVFEDCKQVSRNDSRIEREPKKIQNCTVFSTEYNPRGPNVSDILKKHLHLLYNTEGLSDVFKKDSVFVACRRNQNLKELLHRGDPYSVNERLVDVEGYERCQKKCDSCDNFVVPTSFVKSFATGRKFTIRNHLTCQTQNVIYLAFCKSCHRQGVGSTIRWKPRLSNYKSHIKKQIRSCRIVNHFIDSCRKGVDGVDNLCFVLLDSVNNVEGLSSDEVDALLLKKEKFWIGTLVTQHKGLNGTHDWNRKNRCEREK